MTVTKKLNMVKIAYWISTGLIALFAIPSVFFMNSEMALAGMRALGVPGWLGTELSIGQTIGGIILLIQDKRIGRLREWVYVAFGIKYFSAAYAHITIASPESIGNAVFALIVLSVLAVSYFSWHKIHDNKN